MHISNLSDLPREWTWLQHASESLERHHWSHHSSLDTFLSPLGKGATSSNRLLASLACVKDLAGTPNSALLVTHGPRPTFWGATAKRLLGKRQQPRHLAFSFNFTQLPKGETHRRMAKAFASVDRFIVFSSMEKELYPRYFDLPPERFQMIHWAVQPPNNFGSWPIVETPNYICALGSQGRDYKTLFEAMKALPDMHLILVTAPHAIPDMAAPKNVLVKSDIPLSAAMNILYHSQFMVLPLRDSETPCGHVTLVSAMHFGKSVVATDSHGVADYVKSEENGVLVEPGNSIALAREIERMRDDYQLRTRLGQNGLAFAEAFCTEAQTVAFLEGYLEAQFA